MEDNKYPKIFSFTNGIMIISFIFFFVLINILVFLFLKEDPGDQQRFRSPASYAEIKKKIDLVKKDKNKKIIFLGASAMWGGPGIVDAKETIPLQFAEHVQEGVSVYNFSFPAARPLDIFIISILLKDNADLFVVDINYDYFKHEYALGIKDDRSKYLRVQQLLLANYRFLSKEKIRIKDCFKTYNITLPYEIYFDISHYLPLLAHKDNINYLLFNKPFPLFFSHIVNASFQLFKEGDSSALWKTLLQPMKDIPPEEIVPNKSDAEVFLPSMNSCISEAFAHYAREYKLPIIFYISPHSPEATKLQRRQKQYTENHIFVTQLFYGLPLANLDKQSVVQPNYYLDELHFTASGHKQISDYLYGFIKQNGGYDNLLN